MEMLSSVVLLQFFWCGRWLLNLYIIVVLSFKLLDVFLLRLRFSHKPKRCSVRSFVSRLTLKYQQAFLQNQVEDFFVIKTY